MEVKLAVDTSRLSDLFRGDRELAIRLGRCEQVMVPLMVVAELKAGFALGSRAAQNEAVLLKFLARPTVYVLCPDLETTDQYARLFDQLKRAGTPIPTNDLWIAALTLQHQAVLVARDRHFDSIPQLRRA